MYVVADAKPFFLVSFLKVYDNLGTHFWLSLCRIPFKLTKHESTFFLKQGSSKHFVLTGRIFYPVAICRSNLKFRSKQENLSSWTPASVLVSKIYAKLLLCVMQLS